MSEPEAYLFSKRNRQETDRLDAQHSLLKQFCDGRLLHPVIPLNRVQTAIADVGTGTGVWIRDVAKSFGGPAKPRLVGFDISSAQFASDASDIEFVVHDILKPFPPEYHGKFDLVHVRLLVCALRQESLQEAVKNIIAILRPGGYLQWQEADPNGRIWTPPSATKDAVNRTINIERAARGLILNIYPSMLKALLSFSLADEIDALHAPMCNTDVMHILNFELHRTDTPALAAIRLEKNAWAFTVLKQMILAGVRRKLYEAEELIAKCEEGAETLVASERVGNESNGLVTSGGARDETERIVEASKTEKVAEGFIPNGSHEDEEKGLIANGQPEDQAKESVLNGETECRAARLATEVKAMDEQQGFKPNEIIQEEGTSKRDEANGKIEDGTEILPINGKIRDTTTLMKTNGKAEYSEHCKVEDMPNYRSSDEANGTVDNDMNGRLTNGSLKVQPSGSIMDEQIKDGPRIGVIVEDEGNEKEANRVEGPGRSSKVEEEKGDLACNGKVEDEASGMYVNEENATELLRQAEEAITLVERFGRELEEGAYDVDATLAWLLAQKTPFTD